MNQALAILWAQFRALRNIYPRTGKASMAFSLLLTVVWYGLWVFAAVAVALVIEETKDIQSLERFLTPALLLSMLYWQVIPVLMVTAGASLEMRRLRVYPIPHGQLFQLEVMLRLSTAVEMLLLLLGAEVGILMNPALPARYALALVPFVVANVYLSAGIRDLLTRLLAWKRFREALMLFVVLLAAVPQVMLHTGVGEEYRKYFTLSQYAIWPWTATARLFIGDWAAWNWVVMFAWMAIGYAFGRWQFERGLRFDEEAARAHGNEASASSAWYQAAFDLPARFLPDPIGALVGKELRSLARSPRFRIVFLMGFSFGLLIWLPMAFGRRGGIMAEYFLPFTAAYSVMLLSEVTIWNLLGFDRSAAQLYWLAPLPTRSVFVAKNLVTTIAVTLEFFIISTICLLFRLKVQPLMVVQAYFACLVFQTFLISIGNVASLLYPRPVDPNESWKRSSATRFQAMLLLVYPFLAAPIVFAFYAQTTWESPWAFFGVMAFLAAVAALCYGYSLERAVQLAGERKEKILTSLAQGGSPVAS
ncbi:MAG: hypothetical protein JNK48_11240 [Bryobacterales bacterium]|nr:hypothetical protein [Bryobacterales bacterium]